MNKTNTRTNFKIIDFRYCSCTYIVGQEKIVQFRLIPRKYKQEEVETI